MQAFSWMRKLLKSERGNVMVLGAAALPLLIGAGAVGLDSIQLALWKRQLQRSADSAALAGARALVQKMTTDQIITAAKRDLKLNNQVPLVGTADVQPPPTAGAFAGDNRAVRVVLNSQPTLPFWSFFTGSSPSVRVTSTAKIVSNGKFCMMALEPGNVTAINMTGNSELSLSCGIATNSTACPAIDAKGSTSIEASPILAVGCLDKNNSKFGSSDLQPYSEVQENPFANIPDPSTLIAGQSCSAAFNPNNPQPGCYSSMNIDSTVTLPKGTYYIKNGNANFGSGARVTGTEVTIVFTGDGDSIGKFDMDGQAEITLKAPKEGSGLPYPGIAMMRDPDRATMDILKINGGQELNIEGALYFPKTRLWFNGNSEIAATCLQIVAQQLEFKGNTDISNNCAAGYGNAFEATYVRLVE